MRTFPGVFSRKFLEGRECRDGDVKPSVRQRDFQMREVKNRLSECGTAVLHGVFIATSADIDQRKF
jgi:hypothetical protein